jgi:hypothetical protein
VLHCPRRQGENSDREGTHPTRALRLAAGRLGREVPAKGGDRATGAGHVEVPGSHCRKNVGLKRAETTPTHCSPGRMPEIGTSNSMSGDKNRRDTTWSLRRRLSCQQSTDLALMTL